MRTRATLGVLLVIAAVVFPLSSVAVAKPKRSISGAFDVPFVHVEWDSGHHERDQCRTNPSYDIHPGVDVIVRNGNGGIIGKGELGQGKTHVPDPHVTLIYCALPFRVTGLPDRAFYQLEVDDRGEIILSRKELARHHWTVRVQDDR